MHGKLIKSPFKAAWWLTSPHLQTILPSLTRRRRRLSIDWERLELRDGDFIDLAWHRSDGPLVMLIHGLEGSIDSHYATPMMSALAEAGFSTLFMHLRGCGKAPNRLDRSYHSGATEDLAEILERLDDRHELPAAVVGFSLGGNLLLKYLGETGPRSKLQAAVAVSVPFRLAHTCRQLEQGPARLYGRYLLDKLVTSYRQKFSHRPSPLALDVGEIRTLYEFDERITAPLNGFKSADDYYQRASCIGYLGGIETPTLILQARDDPFMTPEVIPEASMLGPGVTLELAEQGGHVGFIHGRMPWKPQFWAEERTTHFLHQRLLPALSDDHPFSCPDRSATLATSRDYTP
jgi:predicted alpha/beta-fold hydrolase